MADDTISNIAPQASTTVADAFLNDNHICDFVLGSTGDIIPRELFGYRFLSTEVDAPELVAGI